MRSEDPIQKITELIESTDYKRNTIERFLKEKDQYPKSIKPTLEDLLKDIVIASKLVSDIIDTNQSLMVATIHRIGNKETPLFSWMMEIMGWYNKYESIIKTL